MILYRFLLASSYLFFISRDVRRFIRPTISSKSYWPPPFDLLFKLLSIFQIHFRLHIGRLRRYNLILLTVAKSDPFLLSIGLNLLFLLRNNLIMIIELFIQSIALPRPIPPILNVICRRIIFEFLPANRRTANPIVFWFVIDHDWGRVKFEVEGGFGLDVLTYVQLFLCICSPIIEEIIPRRVATQINIWSQPMRLNRLIILSRFPIRAHLSHVKFANWRLLRHIGRALIFIQFDFYGSKAAFDLLFSFLNLFLRRPEKFIW